MSGDKAPSLVLDLFCGEGGAAQGYSDAGFNVVGCDSEYQPLKRYPFNAYYADWREVLSEIRYIEWSGCRRRGFIMNGNVQQEIAFIHASPPCQHYSALNRVNDREYPALIEPVREALKATGLPYVIENVEGAPLIDPVVLCGSQFGRVAWWAGHGRVGLRRHRLFETSFPVADPGPHDHSLLSVPVYGHGVAGNRTKLRGPGAAQAARDVMGIGWMTRHGLDQSIPPAYTKYIGEQFIAWREARASRKGMESGEGKAA